MFSLRPDYSSRSPSCSRLWRRQNSWRTSKLMNPLIFLVKTITPTLNMSPHTPFKNVYDDWRHTVLKKGSAFLVQQNAKAQTNFRGWESIFIIYKVVYMYAIVHCTKHHGKDNQITLSAQSVPFNWNYFQVSRQPWFVKNVKKWIRIEAGKFITRSIVLKCLKCLDFYPDLIRLSEYISLFDKIFWIISNAEWIHGWVNPSN